MNRLTSEQLEKVNELKRGKFYMYKPSSVYDTRIKVGKFMYLVNVGHRTAAINLGDPVFTQKIDDPCTFSGASPGHYSIGVGNINDFTPIDPPEGAPADWEPSADDLRALVCPPAGVGGRRRKTRRSKHTKRTKRGSRKN